MTKPSHYFKNIVQLFIGISSLYFLFNPNIFDSDETYFTKTMATQKAIDFLIKNKLDSIGIPTKSIQKKPYEYGIIKNIQISTPYYSKPKINAIDTNVFYHSASEDSSFHQFVFLEKNYKSIYDGIALEVSLWEDSIKKQRIQSYTWDFTSIVDTLKSLSQDKRSKLTKRYYSLSFEITEIDSINFISFDTNDTDEIDILKSYIKAHNYKSPYDVYGKKFHQTYKKVLVAW